MSSIFSQDWRDCLDAHYRDVVQRGDSLTEKSLTKVLTELGYREDQLRQMKLYATMRTEDLQADFIPTLEVPFLPSDEPESIPTTVVESGEVMEEVAEPDPLTISDTLDELDVLEDLPNLNLVMDSSATDDDLPQQLSMF